MSLPAQKPSQHGTSGPAPCSPESAYREALRALQGAGIEFLVGGAYELDHHLALHARDTKDLDLFVRPRDFDATLDVLAAAGFATESFAHWLGKAHCCEHFVDIIYRSGNGEVIVDDDWFANCESADVLGSSVRLAALEHGIHTRSFVMERERFDGADVLHLLRACAERIDWRQLLDLFGDYWRVLASHLILFGFVYPSERHRVPRWVMDDVLARLEDETAAPAVLDRVCRGTLLSRAQYLIDLEAWGYEDARARPRGRLTPREIETWTLAIGDEE